MSQFPTNKTVPLAEDIGVAGALPAPASTQTRQPLNEVLQALNSAVQQASTNAQQALDAEANTRAQADANLQSQINAEITNRQNADSAEALARSNADLAEAQTRSDNDTKLQNQIDGERAPLRVSQTGTPAVAVAAATQSRFDQSGIASNTLGVPSGAFQSTFPGANVNFQTGVITYTGGVPANGSFTTGALAGQGGKYTKYSIVMLPTAPDTLLVSWGGDFQSTAAAAAAPVVTGGVPVAIVTVKVKADASGLENVSQADILQFVAAGSGGGGAGGGSPLDPQADETFTYYTRSAFDIDQKAFFGSTTGNEQILGLKKVTLTAGQQFISKDLTGPQFRADQVTINVAQARLMYNTGKVDTAPTVAASLDGGATWTNGTVSLPGSLGNIVQADFNFATPTSPAVDGGTPNGTLSTGQRVYAVVSPSYRTIVTAFSMYLRTTATLGAVVGKLYSVSAGTPQTLLATSAETYTAGQEITSTGKFASFSFKNIAFEAGTQYALVVEGVGLNANLSADQVTTAPATSISSGTHNGSGFSAGAQKLAFKLYGPGGDLRLRITASATSELAGFGMEYVSDTPAAVRGDNSYEERIITATEATTGLIALQGVRYTVGARQLMVNHNGHTFMGSDFTELSSGEVKFAGGFFQPGDVVRFYNSYGLVDGTSQALSKIGSMYDAIVGSTAQVAAGIATHSSLQLAITQLSPGSSILLISTVTENITLNKNLKIEGKGYGTTINGTFALSGNYATIRDLRFGGNVTITGAGNFVRDSFMASTASLTDTGAANSKAIIQE